MLSFIDHFPSTFLPHLLLIFLTTPQSSLSPSLFLSHHLFHFLSRLLISLSHSITIHDGYISVTSLYNFFIFSPMLSYSKTTWEMFVHWYQKPPICILELSVLLTWFNAMKKESNLCLFIYPPPPPHKSACWLCSKWAWWEHSNPQVCRFKSLLNTNPILIRGTKWNREENFDIKSVLTQKRGQPIYFLQI